MQRLGSPPVHEQKKGAMLLQIDQEEHSKVLPEVSEVLSKPKSVLDTLSSRVNSLQERLLEAQKHSTATVTALKEEYESKLQAQYKANAKLSHDNKDTSSRIDALKDANLELRAKARTLTKQSASLTAELETLRGNVSTAHEYIENALAGSVQLYKAPQLKILGDLDAQELQAAKIRAHENRLSEIKTALLQTSPGLAEQDSAQKILGSMSAALEDLVKEQDSSTASLKTAFEKEFEAGEVQHKKLLKEKAELNTAETAELDLKEKLTEAVRHLEQTRGKLLQQTQNLRLYMQRIGSPPERK